LFDRLGFIIGEAITAMRRNGFMTFAAITTSAVSLFLIGGAAYVYLRAVEYADTIPGKFDMRVYLREGTDADTIRKTAASIRALPGVKEVNWMPKEKVWELEKLRSPQLTEGIDNPLPDAYKVTIKDLGLGDQIASEIKAMPAVEPADGIQYLKDEQAAVDQGIRILRWLGVAVGGLLLLTSGVLIFNAIRLAVLARQLEIRIMRLVGASPSTVYIPFLLEGIVQGMLGGLLSALLLFLSNKQVLMQIRTMMPLASFPPFPVWPALGVLGASGALYGFVCSLLSLRTRHEAR
jgi:cell division transport system permease protein